MVQQNPALIQPLIQQLAQSNPALAQQLAENPQALYALLGGLGGDGGDDEEWEGADELMGQFEGEGDDGEGGHQNIVSVTEEERGAIERVSNKPLISDTKTKLTLILILARVDGLRQESGARSFPPLRPERGDGRQLPL